MVIVVAGSVLVLFDIPLVFLLIGIIALAFLVLVINGSIHLPSFKLPSRGPRVRKDSGTKKKETKPVETKKEPAQKKGKTEPIPDKTVAAKPKKSGGGAFGSFKEMVNSMGKAFSVLAKDIRKARRPSSAKKTDQKKLDSMIDKSVRGTAPDIRSFEDANPEIIEAGKKTVDDPFSTLVKEQMNTELLGTTEPGDDLGDISLLDDIDLGVDMSGSFGDDISNLDIALNEEDEKIVIDDDTGGDEVASILEANKADLAEDAGDADKGTKADDMGLGGLEDLDINDIDFNEEIGEPEGTEGVSAKKERVKEEKPASGPVTTTPSPAAAQEPFGFGSAPAAMVAPSEKGSKMEDTMVSFSTGKGMDDDLMSSLKSEVSSVKKDQNAPLLRDLKDVKVPAKDLEQELQGILTITKPKK